MKGDPLLRWSARWFTLLLRLYPADFRDEMGHSLVEAYEDRAREAQKRAGFLGLAALWLRALADALRSGPGERAHPAGAWRSRGWGRDAELAARRLMRAPAFVGAMLGTLTVGIGAFAVVYTVVEQILIAPMPYKDPDDLYFVWRDYGPMFDLKRGWLAGTDVAELQRAGGVIDGAAVLSRQRMIFAVKEGSDPTEISVMATSPNLFELLGVSPAQGRGFAPDEVGPTRPPIIVLTHQLWNRLGADRAIVGTEVRLNGQPSTVVGVMPPTFAFVRNASLGPPQAVDAYVPFNLSLADTSPNAGSYAGLVRARRGTSPQQVAGVVEAVGRVVDARDFKGRGLKLYPVGLKPDLVSPVRPALVVLGLAGIFLLLVLMVNLASVLLARAAQREHEFAVSRALGANGIAVARATLIEGGLLGLLGGLAGALAAVWGTRALVALAPLDLPRRDAIAVDWSIAAVVVGLATLLGLLAATVPAAWAARTSLSSLLAASAVRGGGGHGRLRQGMVVAQVALSLILLMAGGLVVRSFDRLLRADPGFRPEGVLTMRVPMPAQLIPEAKDAMALQSRVIDALAALPGVTAVSAAETLPMTAGMSQATIAIPGAPGNSGNVDRDRPLVDYTATRAGYVELMGMRLLAGRAFAPVRPEGVREAVIDHTLARHFFPNSDPVGATIPFGDDQTLTVIGVVEQARLYDVHQDGRPQLYLRAEDFDYRTMAFVIRTPRDPHSLVPEVRAAVRQVDPRLALADVRTMEEIVGSALRQQRMSAVLLAGFALAALLLAGMGLFGIISGSVTRRRHEFAVRLALGAVPGSVMRLVLSDGARLVAIGILMALPGIYLTGNLLRGVLVGTSPTDPLTLAAVSIGLALIAMVACYLPARRVLGIEPGQSLRQE
jgi:putative ABC transport system permease protein